MTDFNLGSIDPTRPRLLEHPCGTVKAVDLQMAQDRLIVTITLGIACASDTSLYVFERASEGWRGTLEFEANGYKTVGGAHGSFNRKVGGGQAPGEWFLIAADVNPWCSSNWQQLHWVVLRPGSTWTGPT